VPGALDEKHVDLETDQFMSQSREPVEFVISISILESYVFALNIIKLMEKPYNFVALEAMLAAVPPNSHPILGNFGGCCASAGMESANTISTTRNRSGIGPLIGVWGLNTATLKHLPLSLAPKSYCGEASTCVFIIFLWTTDGRHGR
jgi:hypothetical protein